MKVMVLLFLICFSFAQSFEEFQRRLNGTRSIKVSFVQKVKYPWQSKEEISKGVFYAQRGGKFRIEYEHPEKTLIVSDGVEVMVYYPKTKTAFVESISKNSSPVVEALFLVSRPLSEVFDLVGEMESVDGKIFILKPKLRDDYFSRVYVEVSRRGNILSIRTEEKSGINTTIEFIGTSYNFTPSENLFKINFPENAKVVRQ